MIEAWQAPFHWSENKELCLVPIPSWSGDGYVNVRVSKCGDDMKHPLSLRRIRMALPKNRTSFSKNDEPKQETRHRLIHAASTELPRPPTTALSLSGIQGHCTALMRKTWPNVRIIALDRQATVARFSKTHWHGRETAVGTLENEIIHGSLYAYGANENMQLWRRRRDGERYRLWAFDFPPIDLMFLDTTGRYDEPLDDLVHMIDDHCASPAVVGVTLVLGKRRDTTINIDIDHEIKKFRAQLVRKTTIIGTPMNYFTKSSMLFFILRVQ